MWAVIHVWGQRVYQKSVYPALKFFVNLKLLWKVVFGKKNWCLLWLCKGCFWQRYLNINNEEVNTSIGNLKSYRSTIIFTPPFFPLAEVILWLCFDQKYGFMSSQLTFGVEDFSDKSRNFRYKFKSPVAGTVQWLTKVIPLDLSSWSPRTPTCTFLHANTIDREVCSGTWRASLWGRQVWQWSEAEQWTQNQFWLMKREVWCFWELQKKMLFSLIKRLKKPKLSSLAPPQLPAFEHVRVKAWCLKPCSHPTILKGGPEPPKTWGPDLMEELERQQQLLLHNIWLSKGKKPLLVK